MAKFEDYAKNEQNTDDLSKEIEDAGDQSEARRAEGGELPERFKGKSPEEIAQSYTELEKAFSRQGQDIGKLRKTVDEMLELQLRGAPNERDKPNTKPVEASELFDNPDETVRRVAKSEVDERVRGLEQELANERLARQKTEFTKQFPTWEDDIKDPAFLNWVREKPHRVNLALQADQQGDWSAAETLFGTYYDQRETRKLRQTSEERKQKVKEITLESSGAASPDLEKTFSRSLLMDKRLAAKRGDRSADYWLKSHAEEIAMAYEEGRIVD